MTVDPGRQYALEELLQERSFRQCVSDSTVPDERLAAFLHFCSTFAHIRHPDPSRGKIKFDLFDAQQQAAQQWLSNRWSINLKARQIGFSTLVAAFAFWEAAFHGDRPILMLSRTEREAIKLLAKSKYILQHLDPYVKERLGPIRMTQTKVEFANGSYIESLPSASDPARGESASLIICDEMAFIPNQAEAWAAIEPVAQVGGRVIMLSTAFGEGNTFHELWVGAESGSNRFAPLFFPWSAAADRDEEWYDQQAKDLPDWQLAQEYPSNPEEAFLKSGMPVFDLSVVRGLEVMEPVWEGEIVDGKLAEHKGGSLRIFEFPSDGGRYVIGVDVAVGLEHGDFSTAHVINVRDGSVVARYKGKMDPDLYGKEFLPALGRLYGQALIGVESNNHGLTTLKYLHGAGYTPIYYDRTMGKKRESKLEQLGFRTTQKSKPYVIDKLGEAMREGLKVRCKHTLQELKTFVRDGNGKMMGSPHDDLVMSLAIANHMRAFAFSPEFVVEKAPPPGSFAAWERQVYGKDFRQLVSESPRGRAGGKIPRPRIGKNYVRRSSPSSL